ARRRASRSGDDSLQVVREMAKANRRTSPTSVSTTGTQLRIAFVSTADPLAIAAQKKLVASGHMASPAGIVKLSSRHVSVHVIGLVHCVFRFMPVGPLKKAG